jgi:SNF2 family DNA or RNA helicase
MLVLHASVLDGRPFLWAETPAASAKKSRTKGTPTSPFDPGDDQLLQALTAALPDGSSPRLKATSFIAWLPTVDGLPVPSSRLISEPPPSTAKVGLAPWSVSVVELPAGTAVDLFSAALGRDTLALGRVVGRTLSFMAQLTRFAGALVAREHFLPGIRQEDKEWRALWEPVLLGPETAEFSSLIKGMPHACRALSDSSEIPPDLPGETVARSFLGMVIDHLVRAALATDGKPVKKAGKLSFDSAHDAWLHALQAPEGKLPAGKDLPDLVTQVHEWQRPITVAATAPFRLAFRLEEPASPADEEEISLPGKWYLRYLLQGADDPSLLIDVEDAWKERGRAATVLRKADFNAREYLLAALGQAAAIDPAVESSLKKATPSGVSLDVEGAHRFLTEKAWLLEQSGFGVLLPAWWTRRGTKNRLSARAHVKRPAMQGGSGLSLTDLLVFNWQVAVGDRALSLKELQALAQMKVPLVRIRGEWVQLSAEEIQAAIDFWQAHPGGEMTVREALRMALGVVDSPAGIPFVGVTADPGPFADLLAQLEHREDFAELPAPGNFRGELRPYQGRGYSWMAFLRRWGLGACLADDMGLGKTVQTLALLQQVWAEHKKPTLLVCPTSVVGNWQKEAARFTPDLPVMIHHGAQRKKGDAFRKEAEKYALVLSSYSLLYRDTELLRQVPWAAVILDEAQNVKNPQAKQSQAARSLGADWRLALTGTPVENHVGDLWSISEFLNPGFLGTQAAFKRNFFIPIQGNRDEQAMKRLKRLTSPVVLRRLKTDKDIITDLPEKLEMKVYCTLTKEQASLYAAVVEDMSRALNDAEGIKRQGAVLGALSKLKQVCNHPAQFLGDNSSIPDRSGKLARLVEMMEEVLEAGDRALVFSQFTEMGEILQRHLQEMFGKEMPFLHGGLSRKQRDEMVTRFQSESGPPVMFLSLKAGGTGLNLTAANHVFHFDRWWNPAVENQATDRAYRIGQGRMVQVHKFVCVGTLEERIDDMIELKQQVAGLTVGTGEAWLTQMSTDELKEIFKLRQEAVGE